MSQDGAAPAFSFYDEAALLERLTAGVKRGPQRVIFLVGSALTAPIAPNSFGVPGVEGIVELIRNEFDELDQLEELDRKLSQQENRYQAAFTFLLGRRGQQSANEIIKRSVWKARKPIIASEGPGTFVPTADTSDETCAALDEDYEGWLLPPATEALGRLVAGYPETFGKVVLTTNFDPLIEASIKRFGGQHFRTVLHRDGNIGQTQALGCHVVHLHGYWYGADTLHTPRQLSQPRPRLKASLASLMRGGLLVVLGYGGWDDTFAEALMEVVLDDDAYPEIVWTFNSSDPRPNEGLAKRLAPGIDRGRVNLYAGIDCHTFFPKLLEKWQRTQPILPSVPPHARSTLIHPPIAALELKKLIDASSSQIAIARVIEGSEEDRPPVTDVCVGRETELDQLTTSKERICFITGIGGQGKSTLAAQYFAWAQQQQKFDYFVWRDCKEESERFENQLILLVEKLSHGAVSGADLANQPVAVLTALLIKHANNRSILLVLDNVDHYVDLERNKMTGSVDGFVNSFLTIASQCRAVFTCRPLVQYPHSALSLRLEGLDLAAAIELFQKRNAPADQTEIQNAYQLTNGHAFWLDLLAAQVAKKIPNLRLQSLVDQIRNGSGELPNSTLQSIWETLDERQRLVLRTLAETVKPETETQLGDYLRNSLSFNRFMRALRSLRNLNLIVVKSRAGSDDVIELHPLIREFIRRSFQRQERISIIDAIVAFYSNIMSLHKPEINQKPGLSVLRHWTENAELNIEAGRQQDAFDCLAEVNYAFSVGDFPGEFARVAKLLFNSISWGDHESYKQFDIVFNVYFEILVKLGRASEYEFLLEKYESTVPSKNARYVNYCYLQCYRYWTEGNFQKSIEWGSRGKELKDQSGVDTRFSTNHHLALAQRDAGIIDPALINFLGSRKLDEVIDPEELDETRGGSYYGNIGRCLHFMGQIDPALICYRKSAILIEKDRQVNHVENKAFIRKWIGELLIMKGDFCLAKTFLEAAKLKWEFVSPPRVSDVEQSLLFISEQTTGCPPLAGVNVERYCVAWIFGRENDFVPI